MFVKVAKCFDKKINDEIDVYVKFAKSFFAYRFRI